MCASNFIATVWTEPFYILTWPLCIRQGWKRNDSVSVEELDRSAGSQVLIPAEHLWCDFKCRPWATNSSPNTNDLYIHYMDKSTGTPPSLEEKKALPNCGNKEIHVLKKMYFHLCYNSLEVYEMTVAIGHWYKIRSTQFPRISLYA